MKRFALALALLWPVYTLLAAGHETHQSQNWPQWRGPSSNGAADEHANPPIEWSETKNVKWKTPLPGVGHSTPAVWQERIYVLSAARNGGMFDFIVSAYNRSDGSEVWSKTAASLPPNEGGHRTNTLASASAATDGSVLIAHFGSYGLFVYDLDGNLKWSKNLGKMRTRNSFGEGSSPALHGDTLLILWDHEGDSFIAAFNKNSGDEIWREPRSERTSWTTPLIVERNGTAQAIVNGTNDIRSYDLSDGSLLWSCKGMTTNAIPSPVAKDNMVYLTSGFRGNALLAIDLDKAKGDITGTDAVVWQADRDTPYVPSPLLYQNILYYHKRPADISARDALTGDLLFGPVGLDGAEDMIYASPSGAAGRVYIPTRDGFTFVLKAGPKFEMIGVNMLEDSFSASPIILGGDIYLRGEKSLYCLRAKE